jgi:hypothetical protein
MACCGQTTTLTGAGAAAVDTGKRVNYVQGMLLGVDDFVQEQAYGIARRHELARELIGYGTVRGLKVSIDPGTARVRVTPGMAWTPSGAPVCVGSEQCCDINAWLANHQTAVNARIQGLGSPAPLALHVVLSYLSCAVDPVPIPGEPCRSEDELTANSRIADSFRLELRLDPPDQKEEMAVRDFADWIARIPVDSGSPPQSESAFLAALRAAAMAWLNPTSPPPADDFMFGSPPAGLETTDSLLRAALRLWATELRPLWRARYGCGPGAVPPGGDDDAVLLATLNLRVAPEGLEVELGTIAIDESRRPVLLDLRMVQELIAQNPAPEAGNSVVAETTFGQPPIAGSSVAYARADHSHGTPTLPSLAGDVRGAIASNSVVALRNHAIEPTLPGTDHVLAFTAAATWAPKPMPLPGSDLPGPLSFGGTGSLGTGTTYARANHVHALPALPSLAGDVTGAIGTNTVVALRGVAVGSEAPKPDEVLMFAKGPQAADPFAWRPRALPVPVAATTAPTTVNFGDTAAPGGSAAYARADHRHGVAALPNLGGDLGGPINDAGIVALQKVRVDAKNPAKGDVLTFDGNAWVAAAGGGAPLIESIAAGVLEIDFSATATNVKVIGSGPTVSKVTAQGASNIEATIEARGIPDAKGPRSGFVVKLTPVWNQKAPILAYVGSVGAASATSVMFAVMLFASGDMLPGLHRVHYELCRFVPVGG